MPDPAQQAIDADAAARYHKARLAYHRRAARECRERQAKLEAICREMGIEVIYNSEGETHGEEISAESQHEEKGRHHD